MYWEYFKYVLKHKYFVMVECFKIGLYWRGIMHDMSKFLPDEFIPYARYFYGDYGIKNNCPAKWGNPGDIFYKTKADFDRAWLLHLHRNPHHHQYWLLVNDSDGTYPLEMQRKYVREMVYDWIGAGLAITGKREVREWYEKNRGKMNLHLVTRHKVEDILTMITWPKNE
jgi:hypothetical protein